MKNIFIKTLKKYYREFKELDDQEKEDIMGKSFVLLSKLCILFVENTNVHDTEIDIMIKEFNKKSKSKMTTAIDKFKVKRIESLDSILINFDKINKIDLIEKKELSKNIFEINKIISESSSFFSKIIIYKLLKEYNLDIYLEAFLVLKNEEAKNFIIDLLKGIENEKLNYSSEEKIEKLEREIFELRNSLSLVSIEKENLELEFEEIKKNYELRAKIALFTEINSEANNSLIDNFQKSDIQLTALRKNGYEIPRELESVIITTKSFLKVMKNLGIKPIEKTEKVINLNLEDSINFNYKGTEYKDSETIKKVIVESSGWLCDEIIITKPSVKEVE